MRATIHGLAPWILETTFGDALDTGARREIDAQLRRRQLPEIPAEVTVELRNG